MRCSLVTCCVLLMISNEGVQVQATSLEVNIHYPEDILNPIGGAFVIGLSSACYGTPACPHAALPWGFDNPAHVVTAADKTGPDTWRKVIDLGQNFTGRTYVQLASYVDFATSGIAVPACYTSNPGIISFPICLQQQLGWYADVTSVSSQSSITVYPSFGVQLGATVMETVTDLYSPQFNNTRDIYTFVPPSVSQNTVRRSVNVLILNDGTEPVLQSFVSRAGINDLMQSGAIPSDLVIIGIPYVGGDGERRAEFAFEPCDSTKLACAAGPSYKGVGAYMEFVSSLVIPRVMQAIGMDAGEVAVAGMSLGALASCAMASANPAYFTRALCMSPSVWWNYGSIVEYIIQNFARTKQRPKSVSMYLGTQEGMGISVSASDPSIKQSWRGFFNLTLNAWANIGLDDTSLHAFSLTGGVHNTISWERAFSVGLRLMYQTDFPASFTGGQSAYFSYYQLSENGSGDMVTTPAPTTVSDGNLVAAMVATSLGGAVLTVLILICYLKQHSRLTAKTLLPETGDKTVSIEMNGVTTA